ncbi:MAG TPA: response regulator transcription factor [Terrimicrobiaceae bacterium]
MNKPSFTSDEPKDSAATRLKRRVLVVDDHPLFRLGLKNMINNQPDLSVCCEASSSAGALREMRICKPAAVIVDISLPGTNGIELTKLMKAELPKMPILVLSMHAEEDYALRALRAGALGYLTKASAVNSVLGALRKVLEGGIYLSQEFSERLIVEALNSTRGPGSSPVSRLSQRELEVLELLGRGSGTTEIASALSISPKTIETHFRSIKTMFGFKKGAEMRRFARGWMTENEGQLD